MRPRWSSRKLGAEQVVPSKITFISPAPVLHHVTPIAAVRVWLGCLAELTPCNFSEPGDGLCMRTFDANVL